RCDLDLALDGPRGALGPSRNVMNKRYAVGCWHSPTCGPARLPTGHTSPCLRVERFVDLLSTGEHLRSLKNCELMADEVLVEFRHLCEETVGDDRCGNCRPAELLACAETMKPGNENHLVGDGDRVQKSNFRYRVAQFLHISEWAPIFPNDNRPDRYHLKTRCP